MHNVSICPTITAETPDEYMEQMERVESFATRIHVDLTDGDFAPHKLVNFDQVWWRGNRTIDLHVMHRYPVDHAEIILAMAPRLVIVHAEAEGNLMNFIDHLHRHGIEVGLALLQRTRIEDIAPALEAIDHLLIFSGNLGYQGGSEADMDLLSKVKKAKELNPRIEVGWDGGVNDQNIREIAEAGVDVINVGGFIQKSENPAKAYATLKALAQY
ncbi:MAG TPA: hypothetical protein VN031_01965 [Candidatus Microsaccharimonas sp.]|nr:hypothetical protein [Candidatus Microsaccharimonas sp.]